MAVKNEHREAAGMDAGYNECLPVFYPSLSNATNVILLILVVI